MKHDGIDRAGGAVTPGAPACTSAAWQAMQSCLVWPALPCWNLTAAGFPSEIVLLVCALV